MLLKLQRSSNIHVQCQAHYAKPFPFLSKCGKWRNIFSEAWRSSGGQSTWDLGFEMFEGRATATQDCPKHSQAYLHTYPTSKVMHLNCSSLLQTLSGYPASGKSILFDSMTPIRSQVTNQKLHCQKLAIQKNTCHLPWSRSALNIPSATCRRS